MPYYSYGYGYDSANLIYLILLVPVLLLSLYAQAAVSGNFSRYSKVTNRRGLTGAQAAAGVLRAHGITDVGIARCSGKLTDHYDPRNNTIFLSDSVYDAATVAAVGVAAHEAGHAVQYAVGYGPVKLRSAIVKTTQFSSQASFIILMLGLVLYSQPILLLGIVLFGVVAFFQLVTLPVEFNASRRALAAIESRNLLTDDELRELVTQMYERSADYEALQKENEQLREMLQLSKEHKDLVFSEPCGIIARNANDMYGGFTINQGSSTGLSLNDPVITSVGLIGRVTDIAPNYAKVSTILSPQVNVGVYTMRTKATGVIENSTSTAEQGLCLMSQILKDADVEPGDVIVTAGQSGLFPEGIIVGTVKEVYDDPNGLSKHALIEPAEDCFAITTVYAVVDFDGKGLSFGDIAQ